MANLTELTEWSDGIYQLEMSDPVEGGASGVSNRPLQQLASRTKWLRARIASTSYVSDTQTASTKLEIDVSQSTEFIITLNETACALSFTGALEDGDTAQQITLVLTQGTGVNKVTWPDNIRWQNGITPVLSYTAGKTDVITLMTYDAGVTWFGFYSGAGF